jgi:hypothetical protein
MHREGILGNLIVTIIASLLLIAMGVVYFIVTLWIVRFSSSLMGYAPDGNWVVLSSAILVVGIMVGSAIKNT